jgi:hypothetical protein
MAMQLIDGPLTTPHRGWWPLSRMPPICGRNSIQRVLSAMPSQQIWLPKNIEQRSQRTAAGSLKKKFG